ncbi:beta-L-arabinofuranosidase domain-containing protein [Acidobacteriota bacterium]
MKALSISFLSFVMVAHCFGFSPAQETDVKAFEAKTLKARSLPLNQVQLLGGPLKRAQDVTAEYLMQLEPDRMLAGYRVRAGLEPKAEGYGGWDAVDSRQLTGHIAGHYLSAVSLMYAATGNMEFKRRADYIVTEFKEVQDKRGDGYLGAIVNRDGVDGRVLFERLSKGEIKSGGFDLNGLWSPWYTLHKTYAGLRDAYRYTGNGLALELEIEFAEWAESILAPLDENQIQRMLNTEFGGMNEVLVDLYADTGDKRWLDLSYKFEHRSFVLPLQRHQDILEGKHGNTQVPKLIGSADRYAYTGNVDDLMAASFFWDRVVQHHSFATGGHGQGEYFHEPGLLSTRVDGRTAETCNVYNMLKLTRQLFAIRPDAHYADFYERALINHILASIDPEDGRTCYMVPVGRGVQHEYQNMLRSFTCCVGSGMESHALHGDGIYYESGDKFWVNLYTPSRAVWTEAGVTFDVEAEFPEGDSAEIKITLQSPKEFTLVLRKPYWASEGFSVKVNGGTISEEVIDPFHDVPESGRRVAGRSGIEGSGTYVHLKRIWKTGDTVELILPKSLRLEPTPDNPRVSAIMWGPVVLAADLGPEQERGRGRDIKYEPPTIPVFVAAEDPLEDWIESDPDMTGNFHIADVGRDNLGADKKVDVNLVPFYRLHRRTYSVYFDLFTPVEWGNKKAEYIAEQERLRQLEEATAAYVQPGEMQPERDFNYQGSEDARVVRAMGRAGRWSRSWFSFDLPVESDHVMALVVTYSTGERSRTGATFNIQIDGQNVAHQEVTQSYPTRFFDVTYPIDPKMVKGKGKITIRFQADDGSSVSAVYGIRLIRTQRNR